MERRQLGQSDLQITPILMGTWQAGKRWWVGIEDDESIRTLRAAYEAGITTIDTAEVYGDGHSEQIVARALSDVRDQVIYATKVFATHLRYEQVIAACENSLRNLQTDWIDLYQIHWPSGSFGSERVPIEETLRALVHLQETGKIRAIGVSNFSLGQLQEAMQYARIDSLQPPYSLFWRGIERELRPYCVAHNITILAYSPLAQGLLTGRFGPNHQFPQGDVRASNQLFQGDVYQRALTTVEQLRPMAERHHCSLAQLALAWVMAQPQTGAIAGARHPEQARENAGAVQVKLTAEDLAEMDRIGRPVSEPLMDQTVLWEFG
jgi:aryl-alcohol dehydrogenase-like predicted oxidoreductase